MAEIIDQQQILADSEAYLGDIGGTESRHAQSFKLSSRLTVTSVEIKEGDSRQGTPTGNWTVRIETDNAGVPSGTLADANAIVTVIPPGSLTTVKATFATPFILPGDTTYWLVLLCDNQSYTTAWPIMATSPSAYANGKYAISSDGGATWTAYTILDLYFKIYVEEVVTVSPTVIDLVDPSGFKYNEYYLYSQKAWEMAPSGVSFLNLSNALYQNAPVIITSSGYETTTSDQPWGQTSGVGKYKKVGFGYFHLLANGQYDYDAQEFAIHPDSSGKIVFNGVLRENVYIEYESGPSGYYIMDTIDYNPMRAEVGGGFVHFSETTEPETIYLSASQNSVRADGFQGYQITATLYDSDFDRVPGKNVVFEIQELLPGTTPVEGAYSGVWSELGYIRPQDGSVRTVDASGQSIEIVETTSRRGEAHVHYVTNNTKSGISQVKAYYLDASGVYDSVRVAQFYLTSQPFTLDLSLLDTLDYLT